MKAQKNVIRWIKAHKRELIIAGVSIAAVIGAVLLYRNRKTLMEYWKYLTSLIPKTKAATETTVKATEEAVKAAESVAETLGATAEATHTANIIPIEVAKHVRNLPKGWRPSPGKIATAFENGIELAEGQTWVDGYWKGMAA